MPGRRWSEAREELAQEIGTLIRAARAESPYSLRDMAKILDMGPNAISAIETGQSMPETETLMRIAALLGVPIEQLLPEDYLDRLRPPPPVLEWFRRREPLPANVSALEEAGIARSSRRSSTQSGRSARSNPNAPKKAPKQRKVTREYGSPTRRLVKEAA